jgi:hypothetical protein
MDCGRRPTIVVYARYARDDIVTFGRIAAGNLDVRRGTYCTVRDGRRE